MRRSRTHRLSEGDGGQALFQYTVIAWKWQKQIAFKSNIISKYCINFRTNDQIARASVRTSTYLAPDFSKTLAHSFAVVPVV